MAVAYVSSGVALNAGGTGSLSIDAGSTIVAGQLLVVTTSDSVNMTITSNTTGWSNPVNTAPGAGLKATVWYKIADGQEAGQTSVSFTRSDNSNSAWGCSVFSGVDSSAPVVTAGLKTGSSTGDTVTLSSLDIVSVDHMIYFTTAYAQVSGNATVTATNAQFTISEKFDSRIGGELNTIQAGTMVWNGTGGSTTDTTSSRGSSTAFMTYTAFAIAPAAVGPAGIKTWNGIPIAQIKTINGIAIGSVKGINGIT